MNPSSIQPSLPSQNPNPNSTIPSLPQNSNLNGPSSLSTTLSSLTALLSLSHQTLNSHSTLTKSLNPNLIPCPFNPNHLLAPESLFSHSLRCPFPQNLDLYPPNYRNTLIPPSNLHAQDTHFQGIQCSELCLSLDEYFADFGSNFFCKDCPAAVNLFDIDNSKKTFTLPGFLSVECVNFEGFNEREGVVSEEKGLRVLASGLWEIRREVERWGDYPGSYSFNVICAILGSKMVKGSNLRKWIVANSPRYGVMIDGCMGDHIVVLVRLCLKAVVREAVGLMEVEMGYGEAKEKEWDVNLLTRMFECPILLQVLVWLGSQLSVLYGDVNGKFFAINMIKQCVLEGASLLLLFPLEEKVTDSHNLGQESQSLDANGVKEIKLEETIEQSNEPVETVNETIGVGVIFVSQVAAAVAALHERCFLEEKIKHLRGLQQLSRYQRMAEHAYVSERADAERKKRPNYRPIIDHDGLPRQASSNEETSTTKTREEILAEERDYKRRRMSYRGKKLKRTALQVMRDIIEEYTEEIKKAGRIGCFVKGVEEEGLLPSESPVPYDRAVDADQHKKGTSDISEAARRSPNHCRRRSHDDQHTRSTRLEDSSRNGHHDLLEDSRSMSKEKHRDEYHSGISKRYRSHGRSDEQRSHRRERDDAESTRSTHYESGRRSSISKYKDYKSSYSASNSSDDFHVRKDDQKLDARDKNRRTSYENHTPGSWVQNGFDDRYNPSESDDMYEDDVFVKYVRPE
ncbi:PREDICTED: U11/U12 small nuclear ribonucleoprotein 48 kDa protein [Theobroma cacao]|uniref:U11/U12 small nuclear ribonucleoprotein 48 kDa protein n=1 Tax=Theobroma cacao TaxID=3641 RepID=A0AB32V5Y1_THECC|nr:PREDICTED: U11/U12 small nuclear ribonucleoprotein 48 kDa protein [Theobroma cacao]XP_007030256.2 PREDICTED: U11/U12 small nuclear ribonucleoprotein 48 kDa protein [Theobroma cacao]XP_017977546.1 PREDICTED: U11/U12 small nuclear ribonucleoprotein 48 kDa protein [Theobroma cacao]